MSREEHADRVRGLADDPDLATTMSAVLDDHLLRDVLADELGDALVALLHDLSRGAPTRK